MSRHVRVLTSSPRQQRGATLAIVLILLLVMTLIALASLRGTLMQERMASTALDRSRSFQAAEAALREGEATAANPGTVLPASGCNKGLCAKPDPTAAPVWEDATIWSTAPEVTVNLGGETAKSRYIVELLADDIPPTGSCTTTGDVSETTCSGKEKRYRITARSQAAGRAEVTLQSIFAVP